VTITALSLTVASPHGSEAPTGKQRWWHSERKPEPRSLPLSISPISDFALDQNFWSRSIALFSRGPFAAN
jgi:hypothetical protein